MAAFTTRGLEGEASRPGPFDRLNLGFKSGGAPERVAENWRTTLSAAGLAGIPFAMPRMVHGDRLADIDALPPPAPRGEGLPAFEPEDCDAICSSRPGCALVVTMADCLTALILDPEYGTIAAVHAGWRGTRARILAKTFASLTAAGRIRPASTWVAFGPCLRAQSLEVGDEVAAQLDPRFLIRREGRTCFDMPADNREQALSAGIDPSHLRDLGGDTLGEPERFFSYRRDGAASGRLAAFICLR